MIGDKVPTIFFSGSGLGIKPFCLGNSKKRKISYTFQFCTYERSLVSSQPYDTLGCSNLHIYRY
jgi:hypothetical protein